MNIDKIHINYVQGMQTIETMIKRQFLAKEIGKSLVWLFRKFSGTSEMTEEDLALINEGIEKVGWKIINVRLSMTEPNKEGSLAEGDSIVEQIKSLYWYLSMPYLYENALGKNKSWFNNRIAYTDKYRFKEEEILRMNMAIAEIGRTLLSIELMK